MNAFKRWTALLIAAAMAITLAACGNKTAASDPGTSAGALEGAVFSAETLELPEDMSFSNALKVRNDQIYVSYSVEEETEDEIYYNRQYISVMDIDGGNRHEIEIKSDATHNNIISLHPNEDGSIWVLCNEYNDIYDEEGLWQSTEDKYLMMRISSQGETLETIDFDNVFGDMGEHYSVDRFVAYNDDNWYFVVYADDKNIIVSTDNTGSEQFRLEVEENEWISGLFTTGDGDIAAYTDYYNEEADEYGYTIKVIDHEAKAWGSEYKMDTGMYPTIYSAKDCFAYMGDDTKIYEYDPETGEKTVLINWVDNDLLVSNPDNFTALGDDKFLFINWDYSDNTCSLVKLTKTADSFGDQTIIKLAGIYIPYDVQKAIVDFNKSNGEYRIKVKSYYSDYGYDEAVSQMNTEIIAGEVPDIYYFDDQLSADWLAARGLLTDLYPYIDGDSDISREDFVQNVLRVKEVDGCLYEMVCYFDTYTVVAASDKVGTDMGWTVQDMKALFEQHPEADQPFGDMVQQDFLYNMCMFGKDDYIDWSTGECNFDSDSFIELLELAATFKSSYDEYGAEPEYRYGVTVAKEESSEDSPIKSGRQLLSFGYIGDFSAVQNYESQFGGEITFIGFPVSEGVGNAMRSGLSVGISSSSDYQDVAWEFVKSFLTDDYQNNVRYYYPVVKAALDRQAQRAMAGEGDEYSYYEEMGMEYPTQEDINRIMEYIDSIDRVYTYDNSIMEIINEEAEPFFAGDKTAQETAKIIQNRMETYINEQR